MGDGLSNMKVTVSLPSSALIATMSSLPVHWVMQPLLEYENFMTDYFIAKAAAIQEFRPHFCDYKKAAMIHKLLALSNHCRFG